MPIIKSETIEGKTYLLSDSLDIWCVEAGYDGTLTMQRLDGISREQAFKDAVGRLETSPDKVEILCPAYEAILAHILVQKYGCRAVLLPDELLTTKFCWAVRNSSATVWSTGC